MKYINAAEILPKQLLKELQSYIDGSVLYVPKVSTKKSGEQQVVPVHFIRSEIEKYKNGFMKVIRQMYYPINMDWHIVELKKLYMDNLKALA